MMLEYIIFGLFTLNYQVASIDKDITSLKLKNEMFNKTLSTVL
jgi:hypothetical protein